MNILALETSSRTGSIAAYSNDQLLVHTELNPDQRTAQSLAPEIAAQLRDIGWKMADVDLIAVAQGPGSFTGLRVGVTTAKTFAYATGCQILGLNTLEIIASQARSSSPIYAVLDAQRRQLYSACYQHDPVGLPNCVQRTAIIDIEVWLEQLPTQTLVIGPGLKKVGDQLPDHVEKVPENLWIPQAKTVGRLAFLHYQSGRRDDLWKMVPQYYRKSAAEEKLEKSQEQNPEN